MGPPAHRHRLRRCLHGDKAATEYARAVEAMVGSLRSALAPETMARTALEAAASAWWLLEPELGARRRVCRLQLVRIKSAVELQRTIAEIGESNADGAFGETPDRVRDYSRQLGLGSFLDKGQDHSVVCETETRPRYTQRVKVLLDEWGVKGAYRLYSGTAHAELYALLRHFEQADARVDSGERVLELTVRPTGLHAAAHAVLLAMIAPLERAGLLFGWHADDGPGAELSATIDYVNARLAELTPAS
jgi:hypothetical protein